MSQIINLLGDKTEYYLNHVCRTIDKSLIHIPSPDTVDRTWIPSDRNVRTLCSLQTLLGHGRLAGTGYVSILPVDQDIEHTAGASFAPNPVYFDPENIVKLAIEGGCNAVASTFGNLGAVARKYAHKIPFIVKLNHNELLTYPNTYDQVLFGSVDEAWNMGAVAVGATIYFGSEQSRRQLVEISEAFERAHELGMATILWCYLRNGSFKKDGADYHASADLTGQADHLGVTIKAGIVKQKRPTNHGAAFRQNERKNVHRVSVRPSDRPVPLPGGQRLHGPRRTNQLRRRIARRIRSERRRHYGRRQQTRRRHGANQRTQSVPTPDERGHRVAARDSGRLPRSRHHYCIIYRQ